MALSVSDCNSVPVPFGTYPNTVQTSEWTPLDPEVVEYKYYAPGIGMVLEINLDTGERVELVDRY
ncbi:MAG: hypothetical protein KKD73_05300 [Proteobacteria bacterium]|nr:hypothetical protein [Pseudomonadota bacterium]MBU1641594.1 hypothetical protein [Pseudomonadota bacterium]